MVELNIKEQIANRRECNFLLDNVINLNISLYPELRYIQNLWALGIIDCDSNSKIKDRFYEEPYITVIRILPKIFDLINNKFPNNAGITDKIRRTNIFTALENLKLAKKTKDFKLEFYENI